MSKLGREHWIFHTQDYMQNTCLVSRQARVSYTCKFVSWFTCICVSLQQCKVCETHCHMVVCGCIICICVHSDWAYAAFPSGCCRCNVCVCVCETCVCGILSFYKLERHVTGWNPIRVYCQHAAVLTWYACYSNLVVENRLSLGYFSREFSVLKPPWFYISSSSTVL